MKARIGGVGMTMLLAFWAAGCSGSLDAEVERAGAETAEEGATQAALINGDVVGPDRLRSGLHLWPEGGQPWCTAARVGPRHILTAAHCVTTLSGEGRTSTLLAEFSAGRVLRYTGARVIPGSSVSYYASGVIESTVLHPSWALACAFASCPPARRFTESIADMALITLRADLADAIGTASIDTQPLRAGDVVSVTGYGCEDGSQRAPEPRRFKAMVTSVLSDGEASVGASPIFPTNPLVFGQTYALTPGAAFGNSSSTVNPGACPGDSGGPLYRGAPVAWGTERIVGVNSSGAMDSVGVARLNYHSRVENGLGAFSPTVLWLKTLLPASSFL